MKNSFYQLTLLFLLPIFFSCETSQQKLKGHNISGELSSCTPVPNEIICTEVFTIQDQFALECGRAGHKAIQCGCHEFLCQTKDGNPPSLESIQIND